MKEKSYPKYSVLMSVYYKERPEWLDYSISSMMNQTIMPDEFVLVEDGPLTEELDEVVCKYTQMYEKKFKVVKIPQNGGLGLALQRGVEECSYEYIARMDSDDYSFPNRIEEQFKAYEMDPSLGLVGSNVEEFEENIENINCSVILPEKQKDIYKFSKKRCPFRHPSLLYKKSEVIAAGNYRDFYLCEDYDLYVRMLRNDCKCYNIQKPLVYMRVNSDFYKRRGGWRYMKTILKFKNEQLRIGYFSLFDYLRSTIPHVIVCLMSNNLRDWVYRNLLRKKKK
ncbi:MAG: glycosyltransferase [Lachnospiraceae bacterium]|nr:glycosyltransferase [Lachnospiraceae bacterium]